MAHILLVEDDEFFIEALKCMLEGEGHHITTADNGKMAVYRLEENAFDCIISDVQMPVMNGIELAKWAREFRPNIPFIMMTGYSEMIGTLDAIGTGAVNLLYKPFTNEEMHRAVSLSLGKRAAKREDKGFEGFAKIPTRSLLHSAQAEFNLYVERGGALVKVISRGEPFRPKNDVLAANAYLFTELASLERLIPMNIMVTKAASKTDSFDPKKKADIIQQSIELLYEKIGSTGLDEQAFTDSVEFVKCYLKALTNDSIWNLISNTRQASNPLHTSAMASTAVAVLIAQALKMNVEDCFKAATSGMFHDIGKLQMDADMVYTPTALLTFTQRALLERHVDLSIAALKRLKTVPEEIITIVSQHHENCDGTGYPRKLTRMQIHPLARMLHVADEFCVKVIRSPGHPGMAPEKAVAMLEQQGELDQEMVLVLRMLLKEKPDA